MGRAWRIVQACAGDTIISQMKTPYETISPQHTLARALDAARYGLNRRVLARRMVRAIAIGLILCFPILPIMLYFHWTALEILITVVAINGMVIAVRLLTGTWANRVDAALFLERQYHTPGLFLTAADVLAKRGAARETGHHDSEIVMAAANCCRGRPVADTKILITKSADLQIWAVNGLLLIALLISAEVGQAVMPHVGWQSVQAVSQKAPKAAATAAVRHKPEVTSSTKVRRTPATQHAILEGRAQLAAQQRAGEAIKRIQGSLAHLLSAKKTKNRRTTQPTARTGTGKKSAEALQAQLLVAARLPGIGTKTQTMLLDAVHALHASSEGHFIPLLHRINRQLEKYLASARGRSDAVRRGSDSDDHRSGAGSNTSLTKQTGPGAGNGELADQEGDLSNAIVTDIPSGQNSGQSAALRWGRGKPANNGKIPARYQMAVERYFSQTPTAKVR